METAIQKYYLITKMVQSFFLPWTVSKGSENIKVSQDGTVTAIKPGDATIEAKIPGLAAKSGFLFIKALGQVGFYVDGSINWDIAALVGAFGLTLLLSQVCLARACQQILSNQQPTKSLQS